MELFEFLDTHLVKMLPVEDDFQYKVMPFVNADNAEEVMKYADRLEMGKLMFAAFYSLHSLNPDWVWSVVGGLELGKFGWKCVAECNAFQHRAYFVSKRGSDGGKTEEYHVITGFFKLRCSLPPFIELQRKEVPDAWTLTSNVYMCEMGHSVSVRSALKAWNRYGSEAKGETVSSCQNALFTGAKCPCGCALACVS